jgi:hypothetical protein
LEEINASSKKEDLLKAVSEFKVLPVTQEAETLAREYIANDIFPEKYSDDALHVA